jgi:DNA invertase Pin-like site-specific DNA recombinase
MAGVAAVFSALERALIARRTSDALSELRSQGRVYGAIPFGYERVGDRLIPRDPEQFVLVRIVRLRKKGHS